jgi:hypothetical protein
MLHPSGRPRVMETPPFDRLWPNRVNASEGGALRRERKKRGDGVAVARCPNICWRYIAICAYPMSLSLCPIPPHISELRDTHASKRVRPDPQKRIGASASMPIASVVATVALVDKHAFTRECIARSLQALDSDIEILPLCNSCEAEQTDRKFDLILYYCHGDEVGDAAFPQELAKLAPTIVLSSSSARDFILEIFKKGARGFIPAESTTLELALGILRLIRAGGSFVPLGVLAPSATEPSATVRRAPIARR